MSDGTAVMIYGQLPGNYCDTILVDLNGTGKGPNQVGIDVVNWTLSNNYIQITAVCNSGISNADGRDYITN